MFGTEDSLEVHKKTARGRQGGLPPSTFWPTSLLLDEGDEGRVKSPPWKFPLDITTSRRTDIQVQGARK
jgi:hypothetical protein